MQSFVARSFACLIGALSTAAVPPSRAQVGASDLRALHQLAVHATVRLETRAAMGTGWLLQQNVPRPIVVTNAHVVGRVGTPIRVTHYLGSDGSTVDTDATVQWVSRDIDLALVRLDADTPPSARALTLEPGDVVRGQRVVLAGQPNDLPFQTSEGVVTGHVPDARFTGPCGRGRNCVVADAAAFAGSSGGPALNEDGRVVGMLWATDGGIGGVAAVGRAGIPIWVRNPTFAFLIHVRTIEGELRSYGERLREQRRQ